MPDAAGYSPTNPPMAHTAEFYSFVQTWEVVIVWDKDHTMVDPANIMRPHMEASILDIAREFPAWKHVMLTENTMDSVKDLFDRHPVLRPVFDMILCEDNYFSRKAVRCFFARQGLLFAKIPLLWRRKVRKERSHRKRRSVNDIFIGKKVVLIDDLRDGRIPDHSFCVSCRLWTGVAANKDELEWPLRIKENILRILRNLYHYKEPERIRPAALPS